MTRKLSGPFDPEAAGELVRPTRGTVKGEDLETRIRADFRLFLVLVWRHLGLPDPTPVQLAMAWWLQHGPQRSITMGFRGVGKSWITAAFALWLLYCDPQKKVLVVSGSLKRSVAFTNFCLSLIREMPLLQHLQPRAHQRSASQAFDVGPATPDQNPSFHASGISSQLPGFRADAIIPDDVETNTNSITVLMREKIRDAVKEFDSIVKPGGIIRFLGTPHDYDSLYNHLGKRGYAIRIFPALYPNQQQRKVYGDRLAPYYLHKLKTDVLARVGATVEPTRFTNADLESRRVSLGNSEFALQFMLDTSLSDAERYPLKLSDLIVMGLDPERGPSVVSWGRGSELLLKELPCLGFDGDHYYRPANIVEPYEEYNTVIASIDSSGRGTDETAICVIAELNGILYLLLIKGYLDGYSPATLEDIAKILVFYKVNKCRIESNFGDGMFISLLRPYVEAQWKKKNERQRKYGISKPGDGGTELVEMKSPRIQKELRILSVLEPVTQQHRLVVDIGVVEKDYQSVQQIATSEHTKTRYALMYQWTHITRERDSLTHDDRVECVAQGVSEFAEVIGVSPAGMAEERAAEKEQEELERLFADADEIGDWPADRKDERMGYNRPPNIKPGRSFR